MELNKLFELLEKARETANWRAAFGEPETVDDKTIIPVAQVTYGYGMGFGADEEPAEAEDEALPLDATDSAGGVGGQVKPLGVLVVAPDGVEFEGAVDETKVALAVFLMIAWSIYQITKTVRVIFARR